MAEDNTDEIMNDILLIKEKLEGYILETRAAIEYIEKASHEDSENDLFGSLEELLRVLDFQQKQLQKIDKAVSMIKEDYSFSEGELRRLREFCTTMKH